MEIVGLRKASPGPEGALAPGEDRGAGAAESVELLDGGEQAYPRMLAAIAAATRGLAVRVVVDGWGSARDGRTVAAALRAAGCSVEIYNRLLALLVGRFG